MALKRYVFKLLHRLAPTLLDRYVFVQILPPFCIALAVVSVALLLERLLRLFNLLAEENNGLGAFTQLLLNLVPHYLGLAIPAALCVSVFIVMGRMNRNEEIDATFGSGISLARLCQPAVTFGFILAVSSFFLYGFIKPLTVYNFNDLLYYATHTGWSPKFQPHMFAQPSSGLMITPDKVSEGGTELHHVFIRQQSADTDRYILSESGHVHMASIDQTVQLDLKNGIIITDSPLHRPTITGFENSTRYMTHSNQIDPYRKRGEDEDELTSMELIKHLILRDTDISLPYLWSEVHFRLARCIILPFVPLLATGLALGAKRSRNTAGLPIAFIILIGFDHLQKLGDSLAATKNISVLAIWLPTLIFMLICIFIICLKGGTFQLLRWKFSRARSR